MTWEKVRKLAAENGLELYSPYCGKHRQIQIIDRAANRHWWTANKAGLAYQSLQSIVRQRELATLSNEQAIADGQESKSFF